MQIAMGKASRIMKNQVNMAPIRETNKVPKLTLEDDVKRT